MNSSFHSSISTSNSTTSISNPFLLIQEELQSSLYLTSKSKSYDLQLLILAILLAISFLSIIVSLGIRIKRKQFWLFRKIITSNGTLISPHPIVLYLLFAGIFLIAMEGYIAFAFFYGKVGSNLLHIMLSRNLTWIPLFLGAWMLTWTTFIQPMISRSSHHQSKYNISNYPLFINIFFILVPLLLLAIVIPLSLLTSSKYNTIFTNTTALIAVLEVAANDWKLGLKSETTLVDQMGSISSIVDGLNLDAARLIVLWRRIWISWMVFTIFFLAIYIFAAITYSISLNRSISKLRQRVRSGEPDAFASQLRSLSNTSKALAFTEISIACIGVAYLAMSTTLSLKTAEVAKGGLLTEVITLGAIWIFASLGLVSCLAILFRTFTTNTATQNSSYHSSTLRSIQLKPRFPSPLPPLPINSSSSNTDAVTRFQLGFQAKVNEAIEGGFDRKNGKGVMESGGTYFV